MIKLPPPDLSFESEPDLSFEAATPEAGQWTRDNQSRGTIAASLGVPVATWATRTRSKRMQARDARRLERAVEALERLPDSGEYVHIVTGQEFRGFDLLPAMLRLAKAKRFDVLVLTSLGFSRDNLAELARMIAERQIPPAKLRILCSDFFRRADRQIWQTGAEQARRLGYGFRSTRNHTKLTLAGIGRRCYVVESSANLRSCANLEQFTITQSRTLFDFHQQWIAQVWPIAEP
jgi:hypothetical protein